jgi:hypothetical protein
MPSAREQIDELLKIPNYHQVSERGRLAGLPIERLHSFAHSERVTPDPHLVTAAIVLLNTLRVAGSQDTETTVSSEALDSIGERSEHWSRIEVKEEKDLSIPEPSEGLFPVGASSPTALVFFAALELTKPVRLNFARVVGAAGFNLVNFDKNRMSRTCQGLVPSKFTRAWLPPDFKAEEKILDRSVLQRVALGRLKSPSTTSFVCFMLPSPTLVLMAWLFSSRSQTRVLSGWTVCTLS